MSILHEHMCVEKCREGENGIKKEIYNYGLIILGSILFAIATVIFIFPHSLLLGGTSGISVILNAYIPFSPGEILIIINFSLLIAAFVVLGKDMDIKTFGIDFVIGIIGKMRNRKNIYCC